MKKENNNVYANLNMMTAAPKSTDKNGAKGVVVKSDKDMRGGKK